MKLGIFNQYDGEAKLIPVLSLLNMQSSQEIAQYEEHYS